MFSLTTREVWSFSLHSMYGSDTWRFSMNDTCHLCSQVCIVLSRLRVDQVLGNFLEMFYIQGKKYFWGGNLKSCWSSGLVWSEIMYKKDIFSRKQHIILIIFLYFLFSMLNFETCSLLYSSLQKALFGKENEKLFYLVLEFNQFSKSPFRRYCGGPDSCRHLHKCGHGWVRKSRKQASGLSDLPSSEMWIFGWNTFSRQIFIHKHKIMNQDEL